MSTSKSLTDQGSMRAAARSGGARLTKSVALISFVILAMSYVVNAMDRQVFPVVLPQINKDFGFSLAQGGFLATVFTLGIGLAGVPTGMLLDRISRKAVILIGVGVFSVFTLLTALGVGFFDLFAYRAFSGVGEAMQNVALFSAVGAYFVADRALAIGALNFAYGLGGFLGPLIGAQLAVGAGDWRAPFFVFAALGALFIIIIWAVVRKRFTEQVEGASFEGYVTQDFDHMPTRLLNRNVVLLGATAGILGLSVFGFIGLYSTFLQESLHLSLAEAGPIVSMYGLGAMLGLPAGYISDRLNLKYTTIAALLAASVVGYLIFNWDTTTGWQYFLSFCEGGAGSGFLFVTIYTSLQSAVRPKLVGRASGIFVSCFYISAALAGYLFSTLVGAVGWGGAGFWQLSILPLIGVVVMLFVDTKYLLRARSSLRQLRH